MTIGGLVSMSIIVSAAAWTLSSRWSAAALIQQEESVANAGGTGQDRIGFGGGVGAADPGQRQVDAVATQQALVL